MSNFRGNKIAVMPIALHINTHAASCGPNAAHSIPLTCITQLEKMLGLDCNYEITIAQRIGAIRVRIRIAGTSQSSVAKVVCAVVRIGSDDAVDR